LATVTAGGNHHAVAQLVDGVPHQRLLSNRECARAQGFPDTYRFRGAHGDVKKQIGNAVPVSIARWLGERAIAALSGQAALAVAS
jgi:DNA (cytosine-5)-methyltransferase 1